MIFNHWTMQTTRLPAQPTSPHRPTRMIRHFAAGTLALLAACAMAACASPFGQRAGDSTEPNLYQGILAHDLADGRLLTQPSVMPVDQGVHEMVAPASNNADAAIIPASTHSGAAAT